MTIILALSHLDKTWCWNIELFRGRVTYPKQFWMQLQPLKSVSHCSIWTMRCLCWCTVCRKGLKQMTSNSKATRPAPFLFLTDELCSASLALLGDHRCLFHQHGLTLILAWVSYLMPSKESDGITYPFPNVNACAAEVWECISIFIHILYWM